MDMPKWTGEILQDPTSKGRATGRPKLVRLRSHFIQRSVHALVVQLKMVNPLYMYIQADSVHCIFMYTCMFKYAHTCNDNKGEVMNLG